MYVITDFIASVNQHCKNVITDISQLQCVTKLLSTPVNGDGMYVITDFSLRFSLSL
jgi:hypothetical protein